MLWRTPSPHTHSNECTTALSCQLTTTHDYKISGAAHGAGDSRGVAPRTAGALAAGDVGSGADPGVAHGGDQVRAHHQLDQRLDQRLPLLAYCSGRAGSISCETIIPPRPSPRRSCKPILVYSELF